MASIEAKPGLVSCASPVVGGDHMHPSFWLSPDTNRCQRTDWRGGAEIVGIGAP